MLGEKIYHSLSILLDVSEQIQHEQYKCDPNISSRAWLETFCSIRFNTARRAGHTYAIAKTIELDILPRLKIVRFLFHRS